MVFSGGCDNKAKCFSLQTGQSTIIAEHSAPIKSIACVDEMNLILTGSWDKTLKFWDGRTSTPAHTIQLPERVYAMDVKSTLAVIGTADKTSILVYDLRNPQVPRKVPFLSFSYSHSSIRKSHHLSNTNFELSLSSLTKLALESLAPKEESQCIGSTTKNQGNLIFTFQPIF